MYCAALLLSSYFDIVCLLDSDQSHSNFSNLFILAFYYVHKPQEALVFYTDDRLTIEAECRAIIYFGFIANSY